MSNGSLWLEVDPGDKIPEEFYAVIETPKGSRNKYEVNKDGPGIILDRVLHSSVVYPLDYGLIPRTYYSDGDPMDVLVITSFPLHPGVIVKVRPIGMMKMIDGGDKDNKILCVASKDPNNSEIKDLKDVRKHLLDEIKNFFETYKILEGKKTSVEGWENADKAKDEIRLSIRMFNEKFQK